MGSDYYILTLLDIRFKLNNDSTNLCNITEIKRSPGYFYDYKGDSDEENYELNEKTHYENQLNDYYEEVEIYKNGNFINETFEKKYKNIIDEEMCYFLRYQLQTEKDYKLVTVKKIKYREER